MQKHKPHKEFIEAVHKIVPELEMLLMYDQESDVSGAVGACTSIGVCMIYGFRRLCTIWTSNML